MLFNISNSIYQVFLIQTIWIWLYGFKYPIIMLSKWLNSSIWPIDGTLTGITNPDQSGPESNGNEAVIHILQTPSASPSGAVYISGSHMICKNIW